MNFYKFWQRRNGKGSFNKELLPLDLFSQVTHIAGIATSGLPRSEIFAQAAKLPYHSAVYFKRAHFLVQELNYDYAEAYRVVGEETKEAESKEFLLRLSSSLIAGEAEADFLAREAYVMGETYGDKYEREVESLSKWTDAYMALIVSAAIMLTISIVSMIIYPISPYLVVTMCGIALLVSIVGAWILYRAAPKEVKTHSLAECSREQKLAKTLFKICLPATVITCGVLVAAGVDSGWIMIAASAIILAPGLVIMRDDKRIDKQDNDIANFLRSLGGVTKAIGATVTEALDRLNFRSLGSLQSGVSRLNTRLHTGIRPELCWGRFISETGSELVNRGTKIFWDGVKVGGDPEEVGKASSMFAMKIGLLRAKRKQVSQSFSWLCIAMHATIASLLMLIYHIMSTFSGVFQDLGAPQGTHEALAEMPFTELFSGVQLHLLHTLTIALIVVLIGANAFAIKATQGGHNYKLIFYLSIMLAISGAVLKFVPQIASALFGSLPTME